MVVTINRELRNTAAQVRLEIIQTKLSLGQTLVSVGESELKLGRISEAHKALDQARRLGTFARRHLYVTNHVPLVTLPKLRASQAKLESRVIALAQHLASLRAA